MTMLELWPCSKCKVEKPLTREFFTLRASTGHPVRACRACMSEIRKAYYKKPGEAQKQCARTRAWQKANPEQHYAKCRAWRLANPVRAREFGRQARPKYEYGITREQYDAKLAAQGARCMICETANPGKQGWFHLDHDHVTGQLRDFLCASCNRGLGYFRDSPERLEAAAAYLRRHAETKV